MTSTTDLFSSREMQSLQDQAPTPLYFQLFTLLKNRILNGSIPHGEQMPTEEELAKGFGVSRITAKRALDDLAAAELVERRRGKGTFVTYSSAYESVHAPLVGELEKLSNLARRTHVKVLDVGKQLPPGDVASEMGLDHGELAWRATRIRCTEDDVPYGHLISWTVGLSKGYTKRELERGVRLDEQAPGTGLGLAIVNDLAKAYGGHLALDTAELGGLRVRLQLPAAASGAQTTR